MITHYIKQRSRGTQGFGFVYLDQSGTVGLRKSAAELKILRELANNPSSLVVFHHRWPTSTDNNQKSAHPFRVELGESIYYLVHNGFLSNEATLKEEHVRAGFRYRSLQADGRFNDSEALAIDFAQAHSSHKKGLSAQGTVSLICLEADKQNRPKAIHFGRNSSPLNYTMTNDGIELGSEVLGTACKEHNLYTYDLRTSKCTFVPFHLPSWTSSYSKGKVVGATPKRDAYDGDSFRKFDKDDFYYPREGYGSDLSDQLPYMTVNRLRNKLDSLSEKILRFEASSSDDGMTNNQEARYNQLWVQYNEVEEELSARGEVNANTSIITT